MIVGNRGPLPAGAGGDILGVAVDAAALRPVEGDVVGLGYGEAAAVHVHPADIVARPGIGVVARDAHVLRQLDPFLYAGEAGLEEEQSDRREQQDAARSEERRVGKECVRKGRYRW